MDKLQERELGAARMRARILTPAVQVAIAPLLLAITLSALFPPDPQIPIQFHHWLWISLLFVPAIAAGSIWQTRLLTAYQPMHERALTGLSLMLGMLLNLVALASTLLLVAIGGFVYFVVAYGVPAEAYLKFLLLFLVQALLFFLMFSPYFLVAGAVLGLTNAALIHSTYHRNSVRMISPVNLIPLTGLGLALSFFLYYKALPPLLPGM